MFISLSIESILKAVRRFILPSRLIDSIRKTDGPQGSGVLSQAWDLSVNDEDDWRDELREASGIGRRRKKIVCTLSPHLVTWITNNNAQRKRNNGPVLSQQVKGMVGEGNQAYVDGRIQDAIRIMQEVIRIEPKAISAWAVLANCQADMGLHDKALQLRIMAAHLKHDPERWYELAQQSRYNCLFFISADDSLFMNNQGDGF